MKTALVTGGAGFLGSHLVEHLLKRDWNVLVADNFCSGERSNLWAVLDRLGTRHKRRLEIIRHDITFPLYVETDWIFNLACPASPVYYQKDPVQTTKTCVHGMINMLGLAKRTGARILQASTSEIYGSAEVHPQTEGYWGNVNPVGPRSCYDEGKRCAETLCFDYIKQHNVDVRVIRIFNTYGPRMRIDDGRVVSNFICAALQGKPITIYGDGKQTRSFMYVSDLIRGMMKIMEHPKPFMGGATNLGNPIETSMKELAHIILRLTNSKSKIIHEFLPMDDPPRRLPDISKAQDLLDWKPEVDLEQGLKRTIEYFREMAKPLFLRSNPHIERVH